MTDVTNPLPDSFRMLTVLQPWASFLVATGDLGTLMAQRIPALADRFPKDVENRGFRTDWRGTILVVAGKSLDLSAFDRWKLDPAWFAQGAVVGTVDLAEIVETSPSPWAEPGRKHWIVTNARHLAVPVQWNGFQGIRTPPADLVQQVVRALDLQAMTPTRS